MTRIEFLQQLRQALENDLSGSVVQENVCLLYTSLSIQMKAIAKIIYDGERKWERAETGDCADVGFGGKG